MKSLFGRYWPTDSSWHRRDPLAKLFFVLWLAAVQLATGVSKVLLGWLWQHGVGEQVQDSDEAHVFQLLGRGGLRARTAAAFLSLRLLLRHPSPPMV